MSCSATLLIADDDPNVVDLLKRYLKPLDCEVISAKDGEEALLLAQTRLPDVVLLDVLMPKKSGWEVCQALKGVQRTSHISVVLITGKGEVKDRLTGLQVGADDYLVKPFEREEVVSRISKLLERKRSEAVAPVAQEPSATIENLLHDRATGLPTVPLVMDKVKEILIEKGELGIVFIDIEQFEAIEAEYGWAYFDEFVRNVGEVVAVEAEEGFQNGIIASTRAWASNFYIFINLLSRKSAEIGIEIAAERMRERLVTRLRTRFPKMQSGQIGFFVGATKIEYQPQIRLDRQIYQGMTVAADAVRDAEEHRKRQLTRELRDIIRRKRVTTLFQPVVWTKDFSVFGYEILTRGPKNSSFLNSDMLFSFARETKLSWELEALALESSLKVLKSTDLGDRKFLVNLEAEMFEVSEFFFHEMVNFFSAQKGRFVFELTERAAIEDYAVFREVLEEFRAKGIEIAIDDAGSGYASLEAIASLAPDYLKITKPLISTLATEPIKQDLVRMLVELARKIGSKTLAEGIETYDEYVWCEKLGIDLLQGYYFAHPQEHLAAGDAEVAEAVRGMPRPQHGPLAETATAISPRP